MKKALVITFLIILIVMDCFYVAVAINENRDLNLNTFIAINAVCIVALILIWQYESTPKGSKVHITLSHLMGLPIPENTKCKIDLKTNSYDFSASGCNFSLRKEKVTDISIKTDTEIQKQLVSSAGGAIAGGLIFGPLGALLGGRTKTKKTYKRTKCLIFTYTKDDSIQFIAFEIKTITESDRAQKILNDFKANSTKENLKIEL